MIRLVVNHIVVALTVVLTGVSAQAQTSPVFAIGITGGTASGKSTLAEAIVAAFTHGEIAFVSQDFYFNQGLQPREHYINGGPNFDHPTCADIPTMRAQLLELKNGRKVEAPVFDFVLQRPNSVKIIQPAPILVFEGIHALVDPEIRAQLDFKIFVDLDEATRLQRRLVRDQAARGFTRERILEIFNTMARPMHELYTEPTRAFADEIVDGHDVNVAANRVIQAIRMHLKGKMKFSEAMALRCGSTTARAL